MGYKSTLRKLSDYYKDEIGPPKPQPLGGGGSGSLGPTPNIGPDPGRISIDLTKLPESIVEGIGNVAALAGSFVGGIAGEVGKIGIPEDIAGPGKNIGAIGDIPGNVLGGIGEVGVSGGPLVKDVVGAGGDVLDFGAARLRELQASSRTMKAASELRFKRATGEDVLLPTDLPPDLLDALDMGASVEEVADELVNRGQAYSSNPVSNLAQEVVFDPLNFVSLGAGAALRGARAAGVSVRAANDLRDLGLGQRAIGTAYNAPSSIHAVSPSRSWASM